MRENLRPLVSHKWEKANFRKSFSTRHSNGIRYHSNAWLESFHFSLAVAVVTLFKGMEKILSLWMVAVCYSQVKVRYVYSYPLRMAVELQQLMFNGKIYIFAMKFAYQKLWETNEFEPNEKTAKWMKKVLQKNRTNIFEARKRRNEWQKERSKIRLWLNFHSQFLSVVGRILQHFLVYSDRELRFIKP